VSSRWRRRLPAIVLGVVAVVAVAVVATTAFEGSLTYYRTPTELRQDATDGQVRLGGLVVEGSVLRRGDRLTFTVTDGAHDVRVVSSDEPPGTFRTGQGVVVEGRMEPNGVFDASQIIVRHSNEYQPPGSPSS
jgi:cytochrome c-type biogenesis protein CcmE